MSKWLVRVIIAAFALTSIITTSNVEQAHATPVQYAKKYTRVILEDNTRIYHRGSKVWRLDLASTTWDRGTKASIVYGKCPSFTLGGQYCFRVSDTNEPCLYDYRVAGYTKQPQFGRPGSITLCRSSFYMDEPIARRQMIVLHEIGHALIGSDDHPPASCKCLMQARPGNIQTLRMYDIALVNAKWARGYIER